jgi:hypothetical protein
MKVTVTKNDVFNSIGLIIEAIKEKKSKSVNMDQVVAFKDAHYSSINFDWNVWKGCVKLLIKEGYLNYKVLNGKAYFTPTQKGINRFNIVLKDKQKAKGAV